MLETNCLHDDVDENEQKEVHQNNSQQQRTPTPTNKLVIEGMLQMKVSSLCNKGKFCRIVMLCAGARRITLVSHNKL